MRWAFEVFSLSLIHCLQDPQVQKNVNRSLKVVNDKIYCRILMTLYARISLERSESSARVLFGSKIGRHAWISETIYVPDMHAYLSTCM